MPPADLLDPIVRLRYALQQTRDPAVRAELRSVEVDLRRQVGPAVPKGAAARLLGISGTALDRWIDRGCVPVVTSPRRSTRLGVETTPLLELATHTYGLRRSGRSRGVVAEALRSLGRRERGRPRVLRYDVARLPRPNVPVEELERHFRETTPVERVLEVDALNRSLSALGPGSLS